MEFISRGFGDCRAKIDEHFWEFWGALKCFGELLDFAIGVSCSHEIFKLLGRH